MENNKATLLLGTQPVGRLLMQYAIPAIIAMTASSLYNMIDSIFIGQGVGPLAISGLAVTFPLMNLSAAFGAMIGIGASTLISMKLGQKDYATAENVLGNVLVLNIIIGLTFSIIALVFINPILFFFGASHGTIKYARDFMTVILIGNVFSHLYFGLNAVLRAASKPKQAMYATIFTVVLNTVLDPIFIYVLDWGIKGAAFATILSQFLALMWQIRLFSNKKELIHFKPGIYRLKRNIVKNIIEIGLSPFSMNVCACLVVILINKGLQTYGGDMAVGAYGIANRISFIFVMIVMGVNQGMQPIAGYNYGSQQTGRVRQVLNYSIIAATCITTVGFLIGELMPHICARAFTTDQTLIDIAANGISINMMAFPLIGCQMVITNFFQSIGKAGVSIFLSLTRQMLFLVPLLIILPQLMGLNGVWYSLPISDTLASVMASYMIIKHIKKLKKQAI